MPLEPSYLDSNSAFVLFQQFAQEAVLMEELASVLIAVGACLDGQEQSAEQVRICKSHLPPPPTTHTTLCHTTATEKLS